LFGKIKKKHGNLLNLFTASYLYLDIIQAFGQDTFACSICNAVLLHDSHAMVLFPFYQRCLSSVNLTYTMFLI